MEGRTRTGPRPAPRLVRHLLPAGPVPARTAGAALVTGALFGAMADHFGTDLLVAPFCAFFALLVAISVTDLTHRLVPRWIVYPSCALVLPLLVATSAVDHRWHSLTGSVIAGAVAFGLFFVVWWFVPRGMGFGDVRLAGVIGFVVGLPEHPACVRGLPGRVRRGYGLRACRPRRHPVRFPHGHPVRSVAGRGRGHRGPVGWPDCPRPLPHLLIAGTGCCDPGVLDAACVFRRSVRGS